MPPKADKSMTELIAQAAKTTQIGIKDVGEPEVKDGDTQISLFQKAEIRKICHNDEWWYSVVDVVGAISQSAEPRKYWSDLKSKIFAESGNNELSENIGQLKMPGKDGKMYPTDCANVETLFRIIQSIPSKNAEPFKKWLARTGYERIQEYQNPEISVKRAMAAWRAQGREEIWIKNRLQTVISRNELTNEWQARGVQEGKEYGALTNAISKGTFGIKTDEHKALKGLGKAHNLRDHMSGLELVLTMLGEEATKEIAVNTDAQGFWPNYNAAEAGGKVAGQARREIESKSGKRVLSEANFLSKKNLIE